MKVKISENFLIWYTATNPHLIEEVEKNEKFNENKELEEYVNDVLLEHMENIDNLLEGDDDSPDSGFIEE